jgi:hypothetical protein
MTNTTLKKDGKMRLNSWVEIDESQYMWYILLVLERLMEIKVEVIKAIKIKVYDQCKVYTTAKHAAAEDADWSHRKYCNEKLGLWRYIVNPDRKNKLERRVLKVFQRLLS